MAVVNTRPTTLTTLSLSPPKPTSLLKPKTTISPSIPFTTTSAIGIRGSNRSISYGVAVGLVGSGSGLAMSLLVSPASASAFPLLGQLTEPPNALSLPTWAVHVSSVAEWITAMALVWQYGEKSGFETWKGLSWGMVPLLGGAFCACTWHFFYNAESLEVLVALQSALTVIGNTTMCIAAFRIYKAAENQRKKL